MLHILQGHSSGFQLLNTHAHAHAREKERERQRDRDREDICFISEGIDSQILGPLRETDSLPLNTLLTCRNMSSYKLRYLTKIALIIFS